MIITTFRFCTISDSLLTLEDTEHEADVSDDAYSPEFDHKTFTYPPDRYSHDRRKSQNSFWEAKLRSHKSTGHLNAKPSQNQLTSTSQNNESVVATKEKAATLSVSQRRKTLSDYGSPQTCSRQTDGGSTGSMPSMMAVGATDSLRLRLPVIDLSKSWSITGKQKLNQEKHLLTRKPTMSTSSLQYHNTETSDLWWKTGLRIEGFAITAEHRNHAQEQPLSIKRKFRKKSEESVIVVGVRPPDCSTAEPNGDKISLSSSVDGLAPAPAHQCAHVQKHTHSILGRRQISTGLMQRQSRSVGNLMDTNQRQNNTSVSSVTRRLHTVL
ncbi:uncharacterized protein LOC134185955 isoform X2 [Corticium candelabrum]|uniref:uncharacterized protein LOC134185955 isoform X2 n=1 Tax=Corticium candelabrum TaxID=121492 RepID=UPI002E2672C2|nr:uncharacterized protein LOC134185955 isoform X2 [Corticium candelabrum]